MAREAALAPTADEDDEDVALAKAEALRDLIAARERGEEIKFRVLDAAREFGVDRATIWRWLKRFRQGEGRTSAVEPARRGPKRGARKIPAEQHELIVLLLRNRHMRRERPSVAQMVREIGAECRKRGFRPPSRRTVQRRIDAIDAGLLARRREGSAAARRFSPVNRSLNAREPLEIVQIDHTLADVILVDDLERKPLRRPWLTLAIDVATRMVAGLHVSLDPPSTLSVAQCIRHTVGDKRLWLAARDIDLAWPVFGLPKSIHLDNAREFKSRSLAIACREWGVRIDYRPVARPHWGGHVERLIGTMMGAVHMLPGTTQSSVAKRGDYKSESNACMTLDEFERWLALQICGQYHQDIHSALGRPPLAVWNDLDGDRFIRMPTDLEAFRIDFLPEESRALRRDGVHLFGITYWSDVFTMMIGRTKSPLTLKYDPRDLSKIWFRRTDGRWIEARYRNLRYPSVSLKEYDRAVKDARATGNRERRQDVIFATVLRQRQMILDAKRKTARRRKSHARALETAAAHRRTPEESGEKTGLYPIDTSDMTRPRSKIERWDD